MNKQQMADELAARAGLTGREAYRLTTVFMELVKDELLAGGKVYLNHVGHLEQAHHAERKAQNPRTGEPVTIPARTVLRMRTSQGMLAELNQRDQAHG